MSIKDIFVDAHGVIDRKTLIPYTKKVGKKKAKEVADYLGVDVKYLFHNPNSILHPTVFSKGPVFSAVDHIVAFTAMERAGLTGADTPGSQFLSGLKTYIERLEKMVEDKDYVNVFRMADKKILIPYYIEVFDEIPDEQKYEIWAELYVRSETGFDLFTKEFLARVFKFRFTPEREERMEEFRKKTKGRAWLTVYHGHNFNHVVGDEYSWTLRKETAQWFANRFNGKGKVTKRQIHRSDVIDFFPSRGEDEVIVNMNEMFEI